MPDDPRPSIEIGEGSITIRLPEGDQTVIPTIPEELRDHEVPSFVVEWIMEADEVATIIQELLQAPTRSLCRAMVAPKPGAVQNPDFQRLGGDQQWRSPTPPVLRQGQFEVMGFADSDRGHVEGLPAGIKIPQEVMDIIAMARKVDAWIWKGMRVNEWALENGAADASWLPAAD